MVRKVLMVAALIALVGSAAAQTKTPPKRTVTKARPPIQRTGPTNDEQDVIDLEKHLLDYARDKNAKEMEPWIAEDFTFTDASGGEMTREQYLARVKNETGNVDWLSADNMHVRIYGDVAVVTGVQQRTVSQGEVDMVAKPGTALPAEKANSAFTDVFRRRGSDWELVQEFVGVMAQKTEAPQSAEPKTPQDSVSKPPKGDEAPPRISRPPAAANPPENF